MANVYKVTRIVKTPDHIPQPPRYVTDKGLSEMAMSLAGGGHTAAQVAKAALLRASMASGGRVSARRHDTVSWQCELVGKHFKFCGSMKVLSEKQVLAQMPPGTKT